MNHKRPRRDGVPHIRPRGNKDRCRPSLWQRMVAKRKATEPAYMGKNGAKKSTKYVTRRQRMAIERKDPDPAKPLVPGESWIGSDLLRRTVKGVCYKCEYRYHTDTNGHRY